jgi:diacylglycerol kinase family enzyme
MNVVVLHNPRSGRGLASRLSGRIVTALQERGHRVKPLRVGGDEPVDTEKLRRADAFVILGGDGSVGYQITAACESGTPIYHAGTGNENLFSRHFRMRRDPVAVVRAIEAQNRARFETRRTKAIGHLAYIEPVFRETFNPSIRPLSVWVDGEPMIERGLGQLLIANCPKYAVNADPARHARMDDGLLDIVFMPSRSSVAAAAWMSASRLRVASRGPGWVEARGSAVRVEWADEPGPVQIDGEWARTLTGNTIDIGMRPAALPVLLPG